ncbi:MAG: hypothetical protein JXP34_02185 [Planctomycetes bacterium]|nr:hypothetical protein [Planctomycetota bacterium]
MLTSLALFLFIVLAGVSIVLWRYPQARRRAAAFWAASVDLSRGCAALRRCRIRGIWQMTPNEPCPALRLALSSRMSGATSVGILDVTAFDLIGKGPGTSGSLLYDILSSWNQVPVSLLLLDPFASAVDPDRSLVSVSQEVIAEMDMSDRSYHRRLRAVVDAIDDLNEHRSAEAKIQVRLYAEKPSMTAILLDRSAFISPWEPIERERSFALFEGSDVGSSFFEVYRRLFIRLWCDARPMAPEIAACLREGSQAVRKDSLWEKAMRAAMRPGNGEKVVIRDMRTA